jgi:hypothetical protein
VVTTSVTDVVCVNDPLVPVIVSGNVPVAVVDVVLTVSVDVFPVVGVGLKLAVAPAGSPLAENATDPAKPPLLVIVTV